MSIEFIEHLYKQIEDAVFAYEREHPASDAMSEVLSGLWVAIMEAKQDETEG